MVQKQRHMLTTNRVESLHLRTLRMVPKSKTMKSTFKARCMSIVLYDTLGLQKTTHMTAESLGYTLGETANKQLQQLTKKSQYYAQRRRSNEYKRGRYARKQANNKLRQLQRLSVVTPTCPPHKDHNY